MRIPLVSAVLDHTPVVGRSGPLGRDALRRRAETAKGLVGSLEGARAAVPLVLKEAPALATSVATTALGAGAAVLQRGRAHLPFAGGAAEPGVPPLGRGQETRVETERDHGLGRQAAATTARPAKAPAPAKASASAKPQAAPPSKPDASPPATPTAPVTATAPAPGGAVSATSDEVREAVQEALDEVAADVVPGGDLDHAGLPLPDYDHLTLPALRARIRKLGLSELAQLREYEAAHGHRLPVLTSIDNRIAKLQADHDTAGSSTTDGTTAVQPQTAAPGDPGDQDGGSPLPGPTPA